MKKRCQWSEGMFPEYVAYHDEEWGVPVHDDRIHFEFLILEGAQAGLSWSTVLKKRDGYRDKKTKGLYLNYLICKNLHYPTPIYDIDDKYFYVTYNFSKNE